MMHALASVVAMSATGAVVQLDLSGLDEEGYPSRKAAVAARLRDVMCELEATIRAKKTAPVDASPAVLGRQLIEDGESYDAGNRTYTAGPGFETLIKAAAVEVDMAASESGGTASGDRN